MKNTSPFIFTLALVWIGFASTQVYAQTPTPNTEVQASEKSHHVVMQLVSDDLMSWKGLMKNLSNLTSGWPELEIMVVCHGPGIYFLHDEKSPHIEAIRGYAAQGVIFAACENTMKGKNISNELITEVAERVPMGIQTLVLKQEEGWAYVKAGL